MAIRAITRNQFDTRGPMRDQRRAVRTEHDEREWFASDAGSVIGVIVFNKVDQDWTWIVLGQNQDGKFYAEDEGPNIVAGQEEARSKLIDAMAEIERMGEQAFDPGDR